MNNKLDIDIYDILVFESALGDIYQDCVIAVEQTKISTIYKLNGGIYTLYKGRYNQLNDDLITFEYKYDNNIHQYVFRKIDSSGKLKEIWKRTNENTYTKIEVE